MNYLTSYEFEQPSTDFLRLWDALEVLNDRRTKPKASHPNFLVASCYFDGVLFHR